MAGERGDCIAINKAISAARSSDEVLQLVRDTQALNLVNCVTALGRIAKLASGRDDRLAKHVAGLTDRAAECFSSDQCQTRHISQALWACAKLRLRPGRLLDAVLKCASKMQPAWFKPMEVSMAVWALGKITAEDCAASSFVARLLPSALARHREFDPQGLANIICGVASLGVHAGAGPSTVGRLMSSLRGRLSEFCPQEVANSLHGLAKLGARLDECEGIACEARQVLRARLPEYSPQQLANAAWAATKLLELSRRQEDRDALDFWGLFATSVQERVAEFNAQEISMVSWAAAQALSSGNRPDVTDITRLSNAIGDAVCKFASDLDAQQLATITLALTKLGCESRDTLKTLAKAARVRMSAFNAQDLDNLASGFSRHELQFRSPKLVAALARAGAALMRRQRMPPRNMANLLMAVAKLVSTCKEACDGTEELAVAAAKQMSKERLAEFNLRDLANAAWGLAIMQHTLPKCMKRIGRQAAKSLERGRFNAQEMSKLLYAMGQSGVQCAELEAAAGAQREISFHFAAPVAEVKVQQILGGTQREFLVREETGAIAGNGGALFEDAFVLAEWLARQASPASCNVSCLPQMLREQGSWRGLSLVELGAGLGLCSIVGQRLGMRVIATDGDETVLDQLHVTADLNDARLEGGAGGHQLKTAVLKWGAESPLKMLNLQRPPDLVVATGCVYGREASVWSDLVETLVHLSGPHTLVILAHGNGAAPGVHQLRGDFYDKCAPHFIVARAPQQSLHPEHPSVQLHFLVRRPATCGGTRGAGDVGEGEEIASRAGGNPGVDCKGGTDLEPEKAGKRENRSWSHAGEKHKKTRKNRDR